jgi:O-acetyl-ADP-ribose deacetylase (regulator of RNase III)
VHVSILEVNAKMPRGETRRDVRSKRQETRHISELDAYRASSPRRYLLRMIEIVREDITLLDVDAIVNAANSALAGGGGVDGAIHRAAGPELARASSALAPCAPGDAVITPGFRLRARYVIHAVGPKWTGGTTGEHALLRSAYDRSFALARAERDVASIAFPAISTGVYGFPRPLAAEIAMDAMLRHESWFQRIVACAFDAETERLYRAALG